MSRNGTNSSGGADEPRTPLAELSDNSFIARHSVLRNTLSQSESRVAQYFLDNMDAAYKSITEIATESGLAYSTIIRFCKKMGCTGFQEFKILLAQDLATIRQKRVDEREDSLEGYAEKVKSQIAETTRLLDESVLEATARTLNSAGQVLVAGVGGSAAVAFGINYRLRRVCIKSVFVNEAYSMAITAATLTKKDVMFAVSYSGSTKELIAAAEVAKNSGARLVTLTNFVHAPLVDLADYSLFTTMDRDPYSCEVHETAVSDFVIDALFRKLLTVRKGARDCIELTFRAVSDKRY